VTGDSQKLTIADLDALIRRVVKSNEPIDLLTLTACQTAVGDDRAALGLAGVAVQAGANSALASLWFINDATTAEFTKAFYSNLKTTGKATALQTAQNALIQQGRHPGYWAPFVLVGSWS
jgi:CHAT domain-containing protein